MSQGAGTGVGSNETLTRDTRMRFWNLKFRDAELEGLYRQSYFQHHIKKTRVAIFFGVIVLSFFAVFEQHILRTPEVVNQVRLLFVLPIIVAMLIVSFVWSPYYFRLQLSACALILLSQIGLLWHLGDASVTNSAMAYLQHLLFIVVLLSHPFRLLVLPVVALTALMTFVLREYTTPGLLSANYEIAIQGVTFVCLFLSYMREQNERQLFATALEVQELREETERQQLGQISWLRNLSRYLEHELRNHVFIVQSNLEFLEQNADDAHGPFVRRALRSATKLSDLCDSVGEASTLESTLQLDSFHPVNFSRVVAERVLERVRDFGEANPIELEVDPNLWVNGSETRLMQVFDHLLNNALDYSSEDAFVGIEVKSIAKAVYFTVHNRGEPLPEDRDVFEVFDTTRPKTNLGLGLYVSRKIIEHHGGTIEARTELGQTIVLVTLPQVDALGTTLPGSESDFDNVLNLSERLRQRSGSGDSGGEVDS